MWQDVFAVDSRVCEARFENMSAENKRDLKPLYLKRRLQLLQASHLHSQPLQIDTDEHQQNSSENNMSEKYVSKMEDRNSVSTAESYQPVMRNKRYISLRVKLLKRQFGLPADVLSLKSLSLSSPPGSHPSPFRFNDPDLLNENMDDAEMEMALEKPPNLSHNISVKRSSSTTATNEECDSFNRVHQILDSLHRSQVTRIMFTKMQVDKENDTQENHQSLFIVSSSLDGKISIASLDSDSGASPNVLPHPGN